MLRFFRKVKRRLIAKGDLKRYLIYAVGEILLVMVGIILALQVNNWNERNKEQKAELRALVDLKQEFENNEIRFDKIIQSKEVVLSQNQKFVDILQNKAVSAKELLEGRIGMGDGGVYTFNPSNGVLNSLINTGRIDNIENDSLKYLLTSWKDIVVDYQEEEESHIHFYASTFIPYEASLIPQPYFNEGNAKFPFHNKGQIESLFLSVSKDLKYQNFILMNERYLSTTIDESEFVKEIFEEVIELLQEEISLKSN